MPRIIDELHEPLGRQLVRQTLHSLAAGWPHLSDLRHREGASERQAAHESERTAAPARYEPCTLTKGPQPKEALRHFEHQVCYRLALASEDPTGRLPLSHRGHPVVLPSLKDWLLTPKLSVRTMTPMLSHMSSPCQQSRDATTASVANPVVRPPFVFLTA